MERIIADKLNKIFDEKETGLKKIFWDLEIDHVENFKFYFYPFNASELSLYLGATRA